MICFFVNQSPGIFFGIFSSEDYPFIMTETIDRAFPKFCSPKSKIGICFILYWYIGYAFSDLFITSYENSKCIHAVCYTAIWFKSQSNLKFIFCFILLFSKLIISIKNIYTWCNHISIIGLYGATFAGQTWFCHIWLQKRKSWIVK